jgi:hypothetical protein
VTSHRRVAGEAQIARVSADADADADVAAVQWVRSVSGLWQEAPQSLEELASEARRLMTAHRGRLNMGSARHDGTGIKLTTTDAELLAADEPGEILGARYPVSVEFGGPATYG